MNLEKSDSSTLRKPCHEGRGKDETLRVPRERSPAIGGGDSRRVHYPPESQKMDLIGHLEELRRRLLIILGFLMVASILAFGQGTVLLQWARRPLNHLVDQLIFISPTEVFMAYLKMAILAGFFLTFPVLLYEAWAFLAPALSADIRRRSLAWMACAFFCFVGGVAFSYYGALPAALKFLVGFGYGVAVAQLTVERYISFFIAFMLIGGLVFEIPIVIGFLAEVGIVSSRSLAAGRKMALVVILVVAAMITPTTDIFNMMVFAVPMIVLYEIGIVLAKLVDQRRQRHNVN